MQELKMKTAESWMRQRILTSATRVIYPEGAIMMRYLLESRGRRRVLGFPNSVMKICAGRERQRDVLAGLGRDNVRNWKFEGWNPG